MCIERLPPSNFGNENTNTVDRQVELTTTEPEDLDDFETDYSSADESLDVFNEYMWMENEQEFEQEEIRRLEEEELTIQCLIAMSQLSLLDEIQQVEDEQEQKE
jgi:hypothetical protein